MRCVGSMELPLSCTALTVERASARGEHPCQRSQLARSVRLDICHQSPELEKAPRSDRAYYGCRKIPETSSDQTLLYSWIRVGGGNSFGDDMKLDVCCAPAKVD